MYAQRFITILEAPVKFVEIDYAIAGDGAKSGIELSGKTLKYHHTGMPCDKHFDNEEDRPHIKLSYLPENTTTMASNGFVSTRATLILTLY